MSVVPAYRSLGEQLGRRVERAGRALAECRLCGHACGVDRRYELGRCRTGVRAVVASSGPHNGEETVLSGWRGSGTIFFSWCNLGCVFCQNADISQHGEGRELDPQALARLMLALQDQGCHNLNLVSPTHVLPMALEALALASEAGLRLPLVWNTGGYESAEALALVDGVVDIYMPDMKYADEGVGWRLSGAADYPRVNRDAVREMHRQVGDLLVDRDGLAVRGLLVRHLALPEGLAGTGAVARFLAEEVSPNTYVNLMAQYHPCHRAWEHGELGRRITAAEYRAAADACRAVGLRRVELARWL
ncbi:MAG: radical SAM protein [Thermoanaerobaculaceae bacterium]